MREGVREREKEREIERESERERERVCKKEKNICREKVKERS